MDQCDHPDHRSLPDSRSSPPPTGLAVDRAQRSDRNLFHAHVDRDHDRLAGLVVIDMVAAAGTALPAVPLQTPTHFARTFGRMPGHRRPLSKNYTRSVVPARALV